MGLLKDAYLKKIKSGEVVPQKSKLTDGDGLYLHVKQLKNDIGLYWRFDYTFSKRRKTYTIGKYPLISITKARQAHTEKRVELNKGIDPSQQKRALKTSNSDAMNFKTIALVWLENKKGGESHKVSINNYFKNDMFPVLGRFAIDEIKPTDIVKLVKRIADRGSLDQAKRTGGWCYNIFKYAMTLGYIDRNPADIEYSMIIPPHVPTSHPSITDPKEIGRLLNDINHYQGYFITRCLLQLAPMLMLRPYNVVSMEWTEIDFDECLYTIEAKKMKLPSHIKSLNRPQDAHIVPLSKQAIKILREIQLFENDSRYVFPNQRGRDTHMCTSSISKALAYMGYKDIMSGHGFRAMARTVLEEQLGIDQKVLELQLGHKVHSHNSAYDRSMHLDKRKEVMQIWSDYLCDLHSV